MAKKLYLHIKWDETIEKNGSKAGDRGIYDVQITEGGEVRLWGHSEKAIVKRLTDDEITLFVPKDGEYIFKLNETARLSYSDGHQVCGDWVDESLVFEIKLSDMSLDEYEASLPEFDIEDGVLKKSRAKGDVVVVPEGVVEIGHKAFCKTKIKEVVLPSTLKKISSFAFSDCHYLKQVTLPEGLEELGFYALSDTAIEEINFPRSLRYIDDSVFSGTPFLKRIKDDRFVILGERFLYGYNGYDDNGRLPPVGLRSRTPCSCGRHGLFWANDGRQFLHEQHESAETCLQSWNLETPGRTSPTNCNKRKSNICCDRTNIAKEKDCYDRSKSSNCSNTLLQSDLWQDW